MTHHFGRDSAMPHKAFSLCGKHLRTVRFVHPDAAATCIDCQTIRLERLERELAQCEAFGLLVYRSRKDTAA